MCRSSVRSQYHHRSCSRPSNIHVDGGSRHECASMPQTRKDARITHAICLSVVSSHTERTLPGKISRTLAISHGRTQSAALLQMLMIHVVKLFEQENPSRNQTCTFIIRTRQFSRTNLSQPRSLSFNLRSGNEDWPKVIEAEESSLAESLFNMSLGAGLIWTKKAAKEAAAAAEQGIELPKKNQVKVTACVEPSKGPKGTTDVIVYPEVSRENTIFHLWTCFVRGFLTRSWSLHVLVKRKSRVFSA